MKKFKLRSGNKPGFKQMGSSPLKTHDGTTSSTTHYKDGSAKSKREVDFSKRHESEKEGMVTLDKLPKGGKMETLDKLPRGGKLEPMPAKIDDGDNQKRKEALLNKGFTLEDADLMIKHGGDTKPEPEPAPEHPKYKKKSPMKQNGKDYISIAKILKDNKICISNTTINDFVVMFKKDNERFDKDKFIQACQ